MRVVVCGAGQVGTTIARHISTEGMNVTVIDVDQEQVRRVDESHDVRGVVGHASHPETLLKAGVRDADLLIAVTHSDEVNMVACQVAYSLFGVKRLSPGFVIPAIWLRTSRGFTQPNTCRSTM